jgi:S-formylglutathione hydrolase FrmB
MDLAAHSRHRLVSAVVVLLLALVGLPSAAANTRATTAGLTEVSAKHLSPRLLELTMHTSALPTDTHVRVLLPAGYASSQRRYPVLYLLNGGGGSYLDWSEQGQAESISAGAPVIIVMPDGGTGGNYTDWYGTDQNGFRPRWETFHIDQLIPWVDRHFRTVARRDQRAIAGLSMGGNGALHYAARHPDLFVAVASFSGANDVFHPIMRPITETTGISDGVLPGSVFGPSVTEELRWRAFNPVDLADNLRGVWVSLAFGNGMPGGPDGSTGVDVIEKAVYDSNVKVHEQLLAAGIPHLYDSYGPGAHNWFYWTRDFRRALPRIMTVFAQHRQPPQVITHWSSDATYSVFGWTVRISRPVAEVSRLVDAGPHGFTLRGTGSATVTSPATERPGIRVDVTVVDVRGRRTSTVLVGADGRLHVAVDLGAANAFQQYTTQSALTGTQVREARVSWSNH